MAQITNFFLGANSGSGFQNLFSEIMDPETAFDIMILKGGPGVGKNTFMREIGRTMEQAGADVEYLWCSGDPDSLDGVVIPALRCAVCDGTSPHGTAPLGHPVKKSGFARGCGIDFWTAPAPGTVTWDTFMGQAFKNRRNCLKKLTRYGS